MRKNYKNIALTVLFVFSAIFIQQCRDCPSKPIKQSKIESYIFNQIYKMNSNGAYIYYAPDSIPMNTVDSVFFTFRPETALVSHFSFKEGLMACKPVFPETQALGDSLKIITLTQFDDQHPINSDVSDCFQLSEDFYNGFGQQSKLSYPINQFKRFSNNSYILLTLELVKKPQYKSQKLKLIVYKNELVNSYNLELPTLMFY
jgi:hypothetical protein